MTAILILIHNNSEGRWLGAENLFIAMDSTNRSRLTNYCNESPQINKSLKPNKFPFPYNVRSPRKSRDKFSQIKLEYHSVTLAIFRCVNRHTLLVIHRVSNLHLYSDCQYLWKNPNWSVCQWMAVKCLLRTCKRANYCKQCKMFNT